MTDATSDDATTRLSYHARTGRRAQAARPAVRLGMATTAGITARLRSRPDLIPFAPGANGRCGMALGRQKGRQPELLVA